MILGKLRNVARPRSGGHAALILLFALMLLALPAASAQATMPWWALEAGSRPTNLQLAPDQSETQQLTTSSFESEGKKVLVARLQVGGETIGCLGAGEFSLVIFHFSADQLCEEEVGFPATETPAALATLLEGEEVYGGEVQVSGPAGLGEGTFQIATPGRWVPGSVKATPITYKPPVGENKFTLGKASSKVTSEGSGRLFITATNVGDAPLDATSEPLRISEELPKGVSAYNVEGFAGLVVGDTENGGSIGIAGPVECQIEEAASPKEGEGLECSFEGELPPYEAIEIEVAVALTPEALDGSSGEVKVSGADAAPKSATQALRVSGEAVSFGIEALSMRAEEEGGATATQAGSHPFQLTQSLRFNSGDLIGADRRTTVVQQPGQPRNVRVKLPPGLVGNPSHIEPCTFKQFTTQPGTLVNECPPESAVGAASVTVVEPGALGFTRVAVPVFDLEPAYGEPARFGFMVVGVPVTIDTELRADESYAIDANVLNASQLPEVLASTVSIWGNPGDPAHDSTRGWGCLYFNKEVTPACQRPSGESEAAFLRMPVSCDAPVRYGVEVEPWNAPLGTEVASAADESPALTGCDLLPFDPSVESIPSTKLASNPSGLDFTLKMPGYGLDNPRGRSEAAPQKLEVALPPGMTANASVAEGLATCSEAQLGAETAYSGPGEGCPEASKIGTVELETPLLEGRLLKGSLFLATPYENPSSSLLALYLTLREPQAGVFVSQALEVKPDPATGQLVSVADEIPQLPFSQLRVHLRSGGRPPLISGPLLRGRPAPRRPSTPTRPPTPVDQHRRPPRSSPAPPAAPAPRRPRPSTRAFKPARLSAAAGAYSPFYMRLTRKDGEQDMGRFSFTLPPGVVPKLAGIPYCSEAGIAKAQSRQGPHGGRKSAATPPARRPLRSAARSPAPARLRPHLRPRQALPRRPLPRRPDKRRRDHPRGRRTLRRRHRGRPRGAAPEPGDPRRRSRRLCLRPDPPHPQGHPADPQGPARLRRPPRIHPHPDLLRTLRSPRERLGLLPGLRRSPERRSQRRRLLPLPGGQLLAARLQAQARPEAQGRHPPRRLPRPQGRLRPPKARRRQPQAPGAAFPQL